MDCDPIYLSYVIKLKVEWEDLVATKGKISHCVYSVDSERFSSREQGNVVGKLMPAAVMGYLCK